MEEFTTEIFELYKNKEWKRLKQALSEYDTIQIADLIEEITDEEDLILFRLLSRPHAKLVFQDLSHDKQQEIIEGFAQNVHYISNLWNETEPDDRTACFEELPGTLTQQLLQHLSPEERAISVRLLGYPEDSIGRLMTPEYVAIKPHYTVADAFAHIRKYGRDSETLNVIYIVDSDWKLLDDIRIKELILASPDQKIEDLMDERFASLNVLDDQEQALQVFQDYDRVALPVTNHEGVLLGIVTFDDMMDVLEEESTEDFHKFGSIQSAIISPLKESIANLYKNRILWLITLVFMNVFSGAALASYSGIIESTVSLVFFLPLLIASGGNAGSQSATLMIRSIAMGDVEMKDWSKLMAKEILVSLLLGVTMAVGVALIASIRAPEVILVVSLSMVLTVMMGSLIGMLLPFIFTKFKLDPATASAPLITSIADLCGIIIYFSIAQWYLNLV